MNQRYKKYHSDVKLSFSLGIENHMLPTNFLKQIPNSTSHYWKYENADKYLGSEFVNNIQNALDDTRIILDKRLYVIGFPILLLKAHIISLIYYSFCLGSEGLRLTIVKERLSHKMFEL